MSPRTQTPVSTKAELVRLLGANESSLRSLGVRRLGLFGSFRRGHPTPDSDVDLYVEFAPGEATFDHFMDLGFLCEDLCGRRVEIVTPNSLSPYLGPLKWTPCPEQFCPEFKLAHRLQSQRVGAAPS